MSKSVIMELLRDHERGQIMRYNDFNEKLVGLQGFEPKKIEDIEGILYIYGELPRKPHSCPCCGEKTERIHDYRSQIIKDAEAFAKPVRIVLRKRRYVCSACGKRFFENNSFLPRYYRMTGRLVADVLKKLSSEVSFTHVAQEVGLSVSTVIRIFDLVSYGNPQLPTALSIDEFKGNSGGEKYQCILTDPVTHQVLDILPKRYKWYLSDYFSKYSRKDRDKVQYFVSDMWKTYFEISQTYCKNATNIVDKYHWIRLVIWAFEAVRKEEQKKFSKSHRQYFKRSKSLLIKRAEFLKEEQKQQVSVMLYTSVPLSTAYFLKEDFLEILDIEAREDAAKALGKWIMRAQQSGLPQFEKCGQSLANWSQGILNSFRYPITNGFTEGCNNKIKVLKRNAYGYRNFKRFRNRILHIFAHQRLHNKIARAA